MSRAFGQGSFASSHAHAMRGFVCRILFVLALVFMLLFVGAMLSACTQEQASTQPEQEYKTELIQGDTLKVLMALDYPPFSTGSVDEPWGYDVAVAGEVAQRLGLSLEIVPTTRESIISVLACEPLAIQAEEELEPQGDIAIAALAITSERDDKVDFSSWYHVGEQAVVTIGGDYSSTTDFDSEETRIAVVKGSTCFETACSLTSEELIAEYSTAQKCLQALQAKEVQAVVIDLPVAAYLLEHDFTKMRILEYVMTGEPYGIAVPAQSSHLKDAVNGALADMEDDGTLERLQQEYLE